MPWTNWDNPLGNIIEQAIDAVKEGAYLLKYGRRGKPKLSYISLADGESALVWRSSKNKKKQLRLRDVYSIEYGQRTENFRRHPLPEKEGLSFSLICNDKSLDLICLDNNELAIWTIALTELIRYGHERNGHMKVNAMDDFGASLGSGNDGGKGTGYGILGSLFRGERSRIKIKVD